MFGKILIVLVCFLLAINLACQSANTTNSNANTSANIPPEFSSSPIPMNGNFIPGITNANSVDANKTTPGIPDAIKNKTAVPKGGKTPGIPDQETIKKQINTQLTDVNIVNNPSDGKKQNENVNNSNNTNKP